MWRIYYGDGTEFSSEDGTAFDAPRTNVQVIAFTNPNTGKTDLLSQSDYYYYEPECNDWGWWHCSREGLLLHLMRAKRPLILFGSMIRTSQFNSIEAKAVKDAGRNKGSWRRHHDELPCGEVTHG